MKSAKYATALYLIDRKIVKDGTFLKISGWTSKRKNTSSPVTVE